MCDGEGGSVLCITHPCSSALSASSLMSNGFEYCTGIEFLVITIHTYDASTQGLGPYIIPHALQLQGQH